MRGKRKKRKKNKKNSYYYYYYNMSYILNYINTYKVLSVWFRMEKNSKKSKINDMIDNEIIPYIMKKQDLDYEKTINAIMSKTISSRNIVEAVLKSKIPSKIKEIHILTIPDNKIVDWLKDLKAVDNEIKEAGL